MEGKKPPIFIGGYPRSGTTFAQQLLREFGFFACDEFHFYRKADMEAFNRLYAMLDQYFSQKWRNIKNIAERRQRVFEAIISSVTGDYVMKKREDHPRFGFKVPNLERNFDFLEELYEVKKPRYVYCLRNGYDVVRSCVKTKTGIHKDGENVKYTDADVSKHLMGWINSVKAMESFSQKAPDRCFLFQFDLLDSPSKRADKIRELLVFADLEVDETKIRDIADKWSPVNQSEGKNLNSTLSDRHRKLCDANITFTQVMNKYGYETNRSPQLDTARLFSWINRRKSLK